MSTNERTINSYALRNALLLTVYGVYGILMLPRIFTFFHHPFQGGVIWVVRIVVLVLYICYLFLGMSVMMTESKIRSNHKIINILFVVLFIDCAFLGFYLTLKNGFESSASMALSLSSIMIACVVIYYFILFQIRGQEIKSLQTMSATLLFFSGGGEIFYHHMPYLNTIMGWFMIWMSLNGPDRAIWKSFLMSVFGALIFFLPRYGGEGSTFLDIINKLLTANQIPPLYSIYLIFGLILAIIIILLRIKVRALSADSKR